MSRRARTICQRVWTQNAESSTLFRTANYIIFSVLDARCELDCWQKYSKAGHPQNFKSWCSCSWHLLPVHAVEDLGVYAKDGHLALHAEPVVDLHSWDVTIFQNWSQLLPQPLESNHIGLPLLSKQKRNMLATGGKGMVAELIGEVHCSITVKSSLLDKITLQEGHSHAFISGEKKDNNIDCIYLKSESSMIL